MTAYTLHQWYAVHKWTSLVCTVFLLLLCLTGLPLVFSAELGRLLGTLATMPEPLDRVGQGADSDSADLDAMIAEARARHPHDVVQFLSQEEDDPAWFVTMAPTAEAEAASWMLQYDGRTGALLLDRPAQDGILTVVFRLHVDMFAGLSGMLWLGAMGLAFAASVVSGVVVYGPFMRRLPFGTVRRGGSPRLRWLDLHNVLGIVTVVWALVVGFTGVVNTLALPLFDLWKQTELAEMTRSPNRRPPLTTLGSVHRAVHAAEQTDATRVASFVAFPTTPFAGPHHYAVFLRGKTPLTSRLVDPVLVEADSGVVTATRSMPWYITVLSLSRPLHFGDYGGMPLKILWAILDLITLGVLVSGLCLWWEKRHLPIEALLGETLPHSATATRARVLQHRL
ncbi:MAG: PepSY domain-containing protein [Nitrospiraceae bacterium]